MIVLMTSFPPFLTPELTPPLTFRYARANLQTWDAPLSEAIVRNGMV